MEIACRAKNILQVLQNDTSFCFESATISSGQVQIFQISRYMNGTTTFRKTTLSITTFSIMTLSISTLSIMAVSLCWLSFLLSVTSADCHIYALYVECRYAECHYAKCRSAIWMLSERQIKAQWQNPHLMNPRSRVWAQLQLTPGGKKRWLIVTVAAACVFSVGDGGKRTFSMSRFQQRNGVFSVSRLLIENDLADLAFLTN